jgi:Predicted aspartyl protease
LFIKIAFGGVMASQSGLNRRQLLWAGAAFVAGPAWAAEDTPADAVLAAHGTTLLTVPVELNGHGPFRFVVDTGADRTVLANTVARQLGLSAGSSIRVQGIVRTVEAASARVDALSAGPVHRSGLELPVLSRESLGADGYLGLDMLDGYRVSIDFRRGELRLLEPRSVQIIGPDAPREVPVKVSGSGGHLRTTNCIVDGVRCTAFVDTGAEISVGNEPLFERLKQKSPHVYGQTIPLTGVTGGEVMSGVTTIKTIRFGGLTIEDSRVAIAALQVFRLWDLEDEPALFIGMNWLRRFNRVSIDYGRKELRFDLANIDREAPLRCSPDAKDCRYLLGSPTIIPRPSVAT